jgi:hypothetical protein
LLLKTDHHTMTFRIRVLFALSLAPSPRPSNLLEGSGLRARAEITNVGNLITFSNL